MTERTEPREPRCWYCDDRGCSECSRPDDHEEEEEEEMESTVEWVTDGEIADGLVRVHGPCHWCGTVYTRDLEPEYVKTSLAYGICEPCIEKDEAERRMVR